MSSFDDFSCYLHSFLSDNEAEALTKALSETEPVVSVRRNSRKTEGFAASFDAVPWCAKGVYLPERAPFTFDPLLHAGCYYVQDASSMVYEFIVTRLRASLGDSAVKYLDLCAAPGGKTTAALDALHNDDFVVANEINTARARILAENITKWGADNCYVSSVDSGKYASVGEFFEIIAVDAPCSGEGMMRKDDDAVAQWCESLIKDCASRQREIVDNAWQALMPGGYLIYSTCTFNRLENEEILNYILEEYGAESIDLKLELMPGVATGIDAKGYCYRFMPHRTKGEGLFVAVVRKPGNPEPIKLKSRSGKRQAVGIQLPKGMLQFLISPAGYEIKADADKVVATRKNHTPWIAHISNYINLWNTGMVLGTIKGRDLIPEHGLALSFAFNTESIPSVEVDYDTAINYLRGETFMLPADAPRGYVCICYKGMALGFMKNLGNRANSLMQKEWRIRSSHLPDSIPDIVIPKQIK